MQFFITRYLNSFSRGVTSSFEMMQKKVECILDETFVSQHREGERLCLLVCFNFEATTDHEIEINTQAFCNASNQ